MALDARLPKDGADFKGRFCEDSCSAGPPPKTLPKTRGGKKKEAAQSTSHTELGRHRPNDGISQRLTPLALIICL